MSSTTYSCRNYAFTVNATANEWRLDALDGKGPFLVAHAALLLSPVIPGTTLTAVTVTEIPAGPARHVSLRLTAKLTGTVTGTVVNELLFLDDRLVCEAWYTAPAAHALLAWSLAPAGSTLACESLHAYVGTHGGRDENGTVLDPAQIELSTATHNWMYASALPRVLFRRGHFNLLLGGTRLAHDFGLELKAAAGRIEHFRFSTGGDAHPQAIAAGAVVRGPRLQAQVSVNLGHDAAHALFTQSLITDGIVPEKRYQPEDLAWRRPWYCTWGDQVGTARSALRQDQNGKTEYQAIKDVLTQDMVLNAARLIRREGINVGTLIIDDGWQDRRGDWNLVTAKFPDMRGLVDELHALDFKVALWWAPFITEADAAIRHRPGFATGPTAKHKERVVDYTNPAVRQWAEEMLDRWFSNGPGGWNIDGLKLDFLLEKIYPESHAADPAWYGEETCFHNLCQMIDRCARRYCLSPVLLHAPYNPHNMRYCAAVYGEERFDTDLDYLAGRPALVDALVPGTWFAPHFNYNVPVIPEFIRRVKRAGGIVQIGKLLSPDVTPELLADMRELLRDAG